MNKRNKKNEELEQSFGKALEGKFEPYWKIILAIAAVAGLFFKIGVWVGEHNKLDEIIKIRSEYTEKITNLTIELADQDRKPTIVLNPNDSTKNGTK